MQLIILKMKYINWKKISDFIIFIKKNGAICYLFFVIFLVIGNYVFASENPTNEANMSMGVLCQKDNIINTIPEVYDPINSKYGIDVFEF